MGEPSQRSTQERPVPSCRKLAVHIHPQRPRITVDMYVDDFKMAGKKENLALGWSLLKGDTGIAASARVAPVKTPWDEVGDDLEQKIYQHRLAK